MHSARRIAFVAAAASAAIGLSLGPAMADPQPETQVSLAPIGSAKNVPAHGSCGPDAAGSYVKFTTGGPGSDGHTAQATGGSKLEAVYAADNAAETFQVLSVVDPSTGETVAFSGVIAGAGSGNPVWSFPAALDSPVLDVELDKNFSQFALCMAPAETTISTPPTTQPELST